MEKITEKAKEFFKGGTHDWDHTLRVYKLAMKLGEKEGADLEILKCAALLHDIGRSEETKQQGGVCHARIGAERAEEILKELNYSSEMIEKISHCIRSHRFRGEDSAQTKEAKVLYDADKLDASGAVGIGRAFLFAGEIGARLHDKNVDVENTKPYTWDDSAYREYLVKLCKIKDSMMTEEGKRIAKERHEFMQEFFERMNKEVDGDI